MTSPLKEALTALADVLAKRPPEEILFEWFRSGRLVGELSVLIKRRHPEVQAEIDRVYQEYLRSSVKDDATRQRKTIDCGISSGATAIFSVHRSRAAASSSGPRAAGRVRQRRNTMPAVRTMAAVNVTRSMRS